MKATILTACVLLALCASLGECLTRPQEFARHFSRTLRKRAEESCEDRLQELLRNDAEDCLSSLFDSEDLEKFNSVICSDECGRKFYDLVVDCYEQDITATVWDVLCAENSKGLLCYNAIDDLVRDSLGDLLDTCNNATSDYCPEDCVADLERSDAVTGCCLYSYESVELGFDETQDMWTACGVEIPGLCTGGLTDDIISLPNGETQTQEDGAVTAAGSIAVLVAALLATLS